MGCSPSKKAETDQPSSIALPPSPPPLNHVLWFPDEKVILVSLLRLRGDASLLLWEESRALAHRRVPFLTAEGMFPEAPFSL